MCTLYCQTHLDQCKPGAVALLILLSIRCDNSVSLGFFEKEQTFVTKPILSSGTITSPKNILK
jgi:hypothetical protein